MSYLDYTNTIYTGVGTSRVIYWLPGMDDSVYATFYHQTVYVLYSR